MSLPPPLTPPDCDLRDFGFMPWEVNRFRKSSLASDEPEAVVAAILLYGEAWQDVPAASLPNNDKELAKAAGYGRVVAAWLEVKDVALRGWIECSDGRLYHPIVAEKARKAWGEKLKQRHRTFLAAIRKHNERNPNDRRQAPSYEQWDGAGRPENVTRDNSRPEQKQDELPLRAHPARGANSVPDDETNLIGESHARQAEMSRVTDANVIRDMASKGRESKGKGDSKENLIESPLTPLAVISAELAEAGGVSLANPKVREAAEATVLTWQQDGIDMRTAKAAIVAFTKAATKPAYSLKRFNAAVRLAHAKAIPKRTKAETEPVDLGADDPDPRLADLRTALRRHIGAREYDGWLKPGRLSLNGSGAILTMPSRFMADWALVHFKEILANEGARLNLGSITITTAKP